MPITFDQAQVAINQLVKQFKTNLALYHAPAYKEASARQEFIDKMFLNLGWDVYNDEHAAPQYSDVQVEPSQEVEGEKKAPDYVFRIGREKKFFVEAKKPGVSIKTDAGPAYQVRRYAWSAKLPLSLLTDFEELAVYDCRTRPAISDQASVARINFFTFDQYPDRWREVWDIFSREAVRGGSFDQYIDLAKGKRGTATVDAEFLKEIEGWREALAHNLALRNPELLIDELNDAVQRTIDRIIFLRMTEDRGIEAQDRLKHAADRENIYAELLNLFRQADAKYNSGLFDFAADKLTAKLSIDDRVLKPIIADLYYPQPYEFSVMPAEILGNVYEQFLGKVIRLTAAHQAKVEEKPEVKKAGGVYYTPSYIVDYIVQHTVGQWIDEHVGANGRSPLPKNFRVLDMACGSGSFLLGAYQYLLDYYLKWYLGHEPAKSKALTKIAGEWRLTTAERKRILLAHIFGVDIDRQAVEVTKLSLLLKVLEGENEQSLQMELIVKERALPNLDANIKCGNSLIGPDYFKDQLIPDPEEHRRVNPFDWQREFPDAMEAGGFDCVIGNPPYVRQETISDYKLYLQRTYQVYDSIADLYAYFIERSLQLTKPHGLFSNIVSNKFVRSGYGDKLRRFIPSQSLIHQFLDFGDLPVFRGATVYPCIFVLEKNSDTQVRDGNDVTVCNIGSLNFQDLNEYVQNHRFIVKQSSLKDGNWQLQPANAQNLLQKIFQIGQPLRTYCNHEPLFGVKTGLNEVFIVPEDQINGIVNRDKKERNIFLAYLRGRNVRRYYYEHTGQYLLFTDGITESSHPNVMVYLKAHKEKLEARTDIRNSSKKWYELRPCSYYDLLRKPKIIYASVSQRGAFVLDEEGTFIDKTCYFIPLADKYLLGLLNSQLLYYYFAKIAVQRRGGYFEYLTQYVDQLPIRPIDFSKPQDKTQHDRMVSLVEKMLALHKQLPTAKTAADRELIQRQIDATDRAIDQLVYELYGLTEGEIKIVEGT